MSRAFKSLIIQEHLKSLTDFRKIIKSVEVFFPASLIQREQKKLFDKILHFFFVRFSLNTLSTVCVVVVVVVAAIIVTVAAVVLFFFFLLLRL